VIFGVRQSTQTADKSINRTRFKQNFVWAVL